MALANSSPGVVPTLGFKLENTVNAENLGQSLLQKSGELFQSSPKLDDIDVPEFATTHGLKLANAFGASQIADIRAFANVDQIRQAIRSQRNSCLNPARSARPRAVRPPDLRVVAQPHRSDAFISWWGCAQPGGIAPNI